jgi:amino-acid N-acetyltransferase
VKPEHAHPGHAPAGAEVRIRRARTSDVREMQRLIAAYAERRILLGKERVTLFEDIQEFRVAEAVWPARPAPGGGANGTMPRPPLAPRAEVIGCGALHVLWEDLAEVRTVAVAQAWHGRGVGHALVSALKEEARELGVRRLFCLTFETAFFARQGFHEIHGRPVPPKVYAEMLRSMDEGVAEFLDLARVKPNTLGNTRMLCDLEPAE